MDAARDGTPPGCAAVLSLGTTGLLLLTLLGASFVRERVAAAQPTSPSGARTVAAQRAYGQLPLTFEANQGQADATLRFVAHGAGYALGLSATQAVLALQTTPPPALPNSRDGLPAKTPPASPAPATPPVEVTMSWLGANAAPLMTGEQQLPGIVNYFVGHNPAQWHTNIPTYQQVRYTGIYPGVDLVYYGTGSALEYDFVVAPGANPASIALGFSGQQRLAVDLAGNLVLTLPGGQTLSLQKPTVYQQIGGARQPVTGSYHLGSADRVGFTLGAYNHAAPLVIDPVFLYSTYLGGNTGDNASAIALDGSGNAYVTGSTFSTNFPTVNPEQANNGGEIDAFVSKLNASGSALLYSTYLGGSGSDTANGIAVDASGNASIAGLTYSTDFPTVNSLQANYDGGNGDAFVSKLNASGSTLIYSTYLGGSGSDYANGIAVDSSGSAYVTGRTTSSDFPTHNALQASYGGGDADVFVSEFNATGSVLIYSTYLGGSSEDYGNAIALDTSGNAYVTGYTSSTNYPTVNAVQSTFGGGGCCQAGDAFVSKLNTAGSALTYSTYLGGSNGDAGYGIAVDASASAYVVGVTTSGVSGSAGFPVTVGAFQTTFGGVSDAFVTKFTPLGTALVYSTFVGGANSEGAWAAAVDSGGDAYITGSTSSRNFPLARPVQAALNHSAANNIDVHAYVSELNPTGTSLLFSTYLEGSDPTTSDIGRAVAVTNSGMVYVAGATSSADFPVTAGALQTVPGNPGSSNAFIARLQPNAARRNDTAGVYRSAISTFLLRNTNSSGYHNINATFGLPGDLPVAGDWTGKGYDSIGVYRPSNHTFYLRNSNSTGPADIIVTYGASGDIPVAGDWTGKGYDSVGVYRPSTGQFLLRNTNTTGNADILLTFGASGDLPLVGDWTGQGKTTVGVYRPASQTYYLRNSNATGHADIQFAYGIAGAVPVMGDWFAQGRDTPAFVVASGRSGNPFWWDQRYLNSAGPVQEQFLYGLSIDTPLAGQWQPGPS